MSTWSQLPDGRWVPAEPMPEGFGVLWGRLWHQRRRDGQHKYLALLASFRDARAINHLASVPPDRKGSR